MLMGNIYEVKIRPKLILFFMNAIQCCILLRKNVVPVVYFVNCMDGRKYMAGRNYGNIQQLVLFCWLLIQYRSCLQSTAHLSAENEKYTSLSSPFFSSSSFFTSSFSSLSISSFSPHLSPTLLQVLLLCFYILFLLHLLLLQS